MAKSSKSIWEAMKYPGGNDQNPNLMGGARDPHATGRSNFYSPDFNGVLIFGTILAAYPFLNCYVVATTHHGCPRICRKMTSSGLNLFSTRDGTMYASGDKVLIYFPADHSYGIILGAVPLVEKLDELQFPEHICIPAFCGFRYEPLYNIPLQDEASMGLVNFSAGRPIDAIPGDDIRMNALGIGSMVGRFMTMMRASDIARLDMFYMDNLVRFFTQNFEHFGAGMERFLKDDEGEITDTERFTPYPWESFGYNSPTVAFKDGKFELKSGDTELPKELQVAGQTGLFRLQSYRGYLGDVFRRNLLVPNPEKAYPEAMKREEVSDIKPHIGVFEETLGIDGMYAVRSAKGIFLQKTSLIPVPKQVQTVEDPNGDTPFGGSDTAYKAAGQFGSGVEHKRNDFVWDKNGDTNNPIYRGIQLKEFNIFQFNWQSMLPFIRHRNDFQVPEISQMKIGDVKRDTFVPDMSTKFVSDYPKVGKLKVDHRTGDVSFYESTSTFGMLDDGSIVIEDGYGSQIKMSGGNIEITCPGDIFFRPGRSMIAMTPKDTIFRSGKHIELSSSEADIRLKAEKNLHVLAGNDGTSGGVLIESRSNGSAMAFKDLVGEDVVSSGIVLKSTQAPTAIYGSSIYIRSTNAQPIVLDADGANGNIITSGLSTIIGTTNFIVARGASLDDTETTAVLALTPGACIIDASLQVGGSATVIGPLFVSGTVAASFYTARNNQTAIPGWGTNTAAIQDNFAGSRKRMTEVAASASEGLTSVKSVMRDGDTSPGNENFMKQLSFSFRDEEQYGLLEDPTFLIVETPWQRVMRKNSKGQIWKEIPVKTESGEGIETMPFPGFSYIAEDMKFGTIVSRFYDDTNGRPVDRGVKEYPDLEIKAPEITVLNEQYRVSIKVND